VVKQFRGTKSLIEANLLRALPFSNESCSSATVQIQRGMIGRGKSASGINQTYGGRIRVESKVGQGSTVAFPLPIRVEQQGASMSRDE
jgi:hypothetical protein